MFLFLLVLLAVAGSAQADDIVVTLPADLDPAVRAEVLQALGDAGATVEPEAAPVLEFDYGAVAAVGEQLDAATAALPGAPLLFVDRLATHLSLWHLLVLAVALAAGLAVERGLRARFTRRSIGERDDPFAERLQRALPPFALDLAALAGFVAVAAAIGLLAIPDTDAAGRWLLAIVVGDAVRMLVILALGRLILAPGHAERRLAPLDDADAHATWRALLLTIMAVLPVRILADVYAAAMPGHAATPLVVVLLEAVIIGLTITFFWRVRRPMAGLIERGFADGEGGGPPPAIRLFARSWHILYSVMLLFRLFAIASERFGAGAGDASSASTASILVLVLLPFVIGGIDAWFRAPAGDGENRSSGRLMLSGSVPALLKGLVLLLGAVLIARSWGADPFAAEPGTGDRIARALFHAGGAILIGWALWRGVRAILAYYAPLARAEAAAAEGEAGQELGETMGRTGSRLETLLPVIQSAAFAIIVVMSGLTALSALGVNIGPLLAGAGVVGLAIGFGAQTLVRDIITGMFYLVEDAFRVGEYIVCSAGKGMVEKISLRSVRLRHHRGPVYTIPFGSMGTVQNHSRDWVKLKLMLRVPLDVDLELVRKTIKKVGIELADNPEFAGQFLEPVKSQGVVDVDDSAFIIAVKFVCRPGQQFVLRRHAYAKLQEAFKRAGIEFAPRKVIVGHEDEAHERAAEGGAAAIATATPMHPSSSAAGN